MSVGAFMDALYTKLTADQTAGSLYDSVSGRISAGYAKENETFPYITFGPIVGTPGYRMGGPVELTVLVQFDIWGDVNSGPDAVHDIEVKLYNLLSGVALTPSGFDRGLMTFTSRGAASVEDDAWRVMDEIQIRGTDP